MGYLLEDKTLTILYNYGRIFPWAWELRGFKSSALFTFPHVDPDLWYWYIYIFDRCTLGVSMKTWGVSHKGGEVDSFRHHFEIKIHLKAFLFSVQSDLSFIYSTTVRNYVYMLSDLTSYDWSFNITFSLYQNVSINCGSKHFTRSAKYMGNNTYKTEKTDPTRTRMAIKNQWQNKSTKKGFNKDNICHIIGSTISWRRRGRRIRVWWRFSPY